MARTSMCQRIPWHIGAPYGSAIGTPVCQNAPHGEQTNVPENPVAHWCPRRACDGPTCQNAPRHASAPQRLMADTRMRQIISWHTGAPICVCGGRINERPAPHWLHIEAHGAHINVPENPLAHRCPIWVCDRHISVPERPMPYKYPIEAHGKHTNVPEHYLAHWLPCTRLRRAYRCARTHHATLVAHGKHISVPGHAQAILPTTSKLMLLM